MFYLAGERFEGGDEGKPFFCPESSFAQGSVGLVGQLQERSCVRHRVF